MVSEAVRSALSRVVGGRRVLLAGDVAAAQTLKGALLAEMGADVRGIVAKEGTGELPAHEYRMLGGVASASIMDGIWAFERAVADLPDAVVAWLDAWDPDRSALVMPTTPSVLPPIAGRRMYGQRPAEWAALEDKTIIDAVWDAAGITRAPAHIVPLAMAPSAHRALGGNTVWSADNTAGWHGGAARVRWVHSQEAVERTLAEFAPIAEMVRVMPFLEGIPCSIHAYVLPDAIEVFRPIEMLILRDRPNGRFEYASVGTGWDPRPDDREHMRGVARAVAEHLRATMGYLGGFSIDGVMTVDGFRPTELNPRLSAGLGLQLGLIADDLPVGTLTHLLLEGDLDATLLHGLGERAVEASDAMRIARVVLHSLEPLDDAEVPVAWTGSDVVEVAEEDAKAVVRAGTAPSGWVVMARFEDVPAGPSLAPLARAVARFASDRLGARHDDYEIPADVRA